MTALSRLAAVCLVGLCQCSIVTDLGYLQSGNPPDAAGDWRDAASSDTSAGANDGKSPETGLDAQDQRSDADLETGIAIADSPQEEGLNLTDAPADGLDAAGDTAMDVTVRVDAAGDGAVNTDAGSPDGGRSCDPAKPFGPPILVPGVQSTAKDGDFRLLPSELTAFFWSTRGGGPTTDNLYVATRPDTMSPFSAPVMLGNVTSGAAGALEPTVTNDGLNLIFRSTRTPGVGMSDIYWASRADSGSDFSTITLLARVNSPSNDRRPFAGGVPNGTNLYFASDRTGDYDIYHATGTVGLYNTPIAIAELNLAGVRDDYPVASSDDLTIVFSSERAGGLGSGDIWMATRPTAHSAFGAPTNVTQVNTTGFENPDWLSGDGCRLYLTSDITGIQKLFMATRPM